MSLNQRIERTHKGADNLLAQRDLEYGAVSADKERKKVVDANFQLRGDRIWLHLKKVTQK